ncbi:MAG TPA: sugar phosphate isomerase/epimerase, partial [Prolixibacteraceae bacterium]|nr:sugar phosphate isomerase/epimerase [Prolixibacteraceae bacterium]
MEEPKFNLSRRRFITTSALATAGLAFTPVSELMAMAKKPDSNFGGVQIGAITYSWRQMPSTAQDILKYCQEAGLSSIELMGDVAEGFAGLPKNREEQKAWRLSVSMDKYKELKKMFSKAGVKIPIVKFAPARWSDEEIDYAFKAAKALGAKGITEEIGEDACKKLGKFAEKHGMYAIYHNHMQPGDPNFSFEKFLAYSPANRLNFDAGHYYGATGKHPNEIVEKLHDRIFSIHLKDKTSKTATPP